MRVIRLIVAMNVRCVWAYRTRRCFGVELMVMAVRMEPCSLSVQLRAVDRHHGVRRASGGQHEHDHCNDSKDQSNDAST